MSTMETLLEQWRPRLTAYSYRMLGSLADAEDAVQISMLKAWCGLDGFREEASLESWLYRITTNACLDILKGAPRRMRPMEEVTFGNLESELVAKPSRYWIEPYPTSGWGVEVSHRDPEQQLALKESLRLAMIAALQNLPPKQRAALILTQVLELTAEEAAHCLECSIASLNSALQRARQTLERRDLSVAITLQSNEEEERFAERFIKAFEDYDLDTLAALMHEDVILSMPPYSLWLRGVHDLIAWFGGRGRACKGSRLVQTHANGDVAFAQYRHMPDGTFTPWSLAVLERSEDGLIIGYNAFLDVKELFPRFGLPAALPPRE